jgi:hypothetical protein
VLAPAREDLPRGAPSPYLDLVADDEALLDEFQRLVARSAKASQRWDALSGEDLRPLIDWMCQPKLARVRRRRMREAVRLLERQPLEEVGGVRIVDELAPPGIQGPSIWDAIFGR